MSDQLITISLGILQIVAILGGGGLVAFRLGRTSQRLESAIEIQQMSLQQASSSIGELKADIAALKAVLTEVALQKKAIERLEHWYDELRRGEGFVYPLGSHFRGSTT